VLQPALNLAARLVASHHQEERKDPFEESVRELQEVMLLRNGPDQD